MEEDNEEQSAIVSVELEKGQEVKNQLTTWDALLEWRIRLQAMVAAANKLPQPESWKKLKKDKGFTSSSKSSSFQVTAMLESLLRLDGEMKKQNPTIFKIDKVDDDEEIASDTEDEEQDSEHDMDEDDESEEANSAPVLDPEDPGSVLADRSEVMKSVRNQLLDHWYHKTRYTAGAKLFKSQDSVEQSPVAQIRQIMENRSRLIKRTQMKRSVYKVLGKSDVPVDGEDATADKSNDEYDSEIFDDDDFYHQLLRELIESKTSDSSDSVTVSRKWLEIQKLRSKLKRKVDTRASKSRKIKFEPIKQLTNYVAPVIEDAFTEEAKDELFNSLFSNRLIVNDIDDDDE